MEDKVMPLPWQKIPGFRNYAHPNGEIMGVWGKVLKPKFNKANGYWWVKARPESGGCATANIHALICLTFNGDKPFPKAEVRHDNGDRSDNSAANLIWGTHKQNGEDMVRHGRTRLGAKHTAEARRKISEANLGKKCSEGCPCKIHVNSGARPCPDGCVCGKHSRRRRAA